MIKKPLFFFFISTCILFSNSISSQHSIARQWNEKLLEAIRNDFARPTVHARNLFHSSVLMYDAWAIFDNTAETVFLGNTLGNFTTSYIAIENPSNKNLATEEIISYAMYRFLIHRFSNAANSIETLSSLDTFFTSLGYDKNLNDGLFVRAEVAKTQFDSISVKSTDSLNVNKVTLDGIDGVNATIAIGKTF